MKHNKSDLWNLNQKLELQLSFSQNQCQTLETMRQVEHLTEANFESFLVRNFFRLYFTKGHVHMPVYSNVKTKVNAAGKYAKQC